MQHIAIDLGGTKSQICIRKKDETIVREVLWETRHLGRFQKDQEHSRVILETCTEAFGVADQALELGRGAGNPGAESWRWQSQHQDRQAGCSNPERSIVPNRLAERSHSYRGFTSSEGHVRDARPAYWGSHSAHQLRSRLASRSNGATKARSNSVVSDTSARNRRHGRPGGAKPSSPWCVGPSRSKSAAGNLLPSLLRHGSSQAFSSRCGEMAPPTSPA